MFTHAPARFPAKKIILCMYILTKSIMDAYIIIHYYKIPLRLHNTLEQIFFKGI